MNISKKDFCYLIIYSGEKNPLYVEKIPRDENFWKEKMLQTLEKFYLFCMLPEIIEKRVVQGLRCKDPPYILAAQEKKKSNEKNKN